MDQEIYERNSPKHETDFILKTEEDNKSIDYCVYKY
jgi:hypothetical protein